jgi:quinoprotein glucose dehydrogenase
MTYRAGKDERQYIVISAGGHGVLGTPRGDYVIAFSLPPGAVAARAPAPR